ncbi:MAG TPA: proline dehydrogenase family protein [Gemmatimonadales bacterium]|jgi:proline dehydrogenase|nr:proline dehydrogenase family protein [Gemmatimonadales bacterium]
MLRAAFLWLSEQPSIFKFVRKNRLARRLASRFVAGETADEAIATLRELNGSNLSASLDLLGESVLHAEEAQRACATYLDLLDRIAGAHANANVSVKLTQMGLDIDEALCLANMRAIIGRAKQQQSFVRIDMEQSTYTARTLQLFQDVFYPEFGSAVGVVLQSYLRRTAADVDTMVRLGARVRLCKGAYKEPEDVAFPDKRDVDANFVGCMERLMERGNYPGIATHDAKIIEHAKGFAKRRGIPVERFEFQMLYGVRRDLQYQLRREGYNMRVYVPFGTHWYPYLMRRLAERPANIAFITTNILKESVHRRR